MRSSGAKIYAIAVGCAAVFTAVMAVSSVTAQPRTIRLGLLTSMTGPAAATGEDQKKGVSLAIEEINVAGGVFVKAFKGKLNLELFVGRGTGSQPPEEPP